MIITLSIIGAFITVIACLLLIIQQQRKTIRAITDILHRHNVDYYMVNQSIADALKKLWRTISTQRRN